MKGEIIVDVIEIRKYIKYFINVYRLYFLVEMNELVKVLFMNNEL